MAAVSDRDGVRGASRTLPVPRYTLTRPSPEAADPTRVFPERSTVKLRFPDQQTAKLPSIFRTSLSRMTSTISERGTLLSKTQVPEPVSFRLKRPSPPAITEDREERGCISCLTELSQARNIPSSITSPPAQSATFSVRRYLPAPTTTASILDATSVANTTANDYIISLGLRADYGTAANTYTNAFVITAVPNSIAYVITYNANPMDTVSSMPAAQNSTTSATSIKLSSSHPSRTNYSFLGWCNVAPTTSNGTDSCSGTTYQPGATYGIDKTTENITTLYAMWKINAFTVTFKAGTGGTVNRTT